MQFATPFSVLDGGLSTALERAGHDLAHHLWTARLLVTEPEAIVRAHLSYLRAGAEIVITASYQASIAGFIGEGMDRAEAIATIGLTTELAREASRRFVAERGRAQVPTVAASVGPYGATLADGSEYHGRYPVGDGLLRDFHRERLEILVASEPDLLACETIPSAAEAAIIAGSLDGLPVLPTWFTFTCPDGEHTASGDPIEDAVEAVAGVPGLVALGVNCSSPEHVGELLSRIGSRSALPLVVYPNLGRTWDGEQHCWIGEDGIGTDAWPVEDWVDAGVRVLGGCCGTAEADVAALRRVRDAFDPIEPPDLVA
ncbi:MAG: homocysteine S-methyltransferase [Ilumatobacteraceae bacterium]